MLNPSFFANFTDCQPETCLHNFLSLLLALLRFGTVLCGPKLWSCCSPALVEPGLFTIRSEVSMPFSKTILNWLPASWRHGLRSLRNKIIRASAISKWEKSGRPLPPPHQVKQKVVEAYHDVSGYSILVETGTCLGDMVDAEKKKFDHIYSVELSEKLCRDAQRRFRRYKHIDIRQGDSRKVLGEIVKQLDRPAIFWLDAHYSGGVTARSDKDCPIYEEIDAIFNAKPLHHIFLIDDARHFTGQGDYPTIEALTRYIRNKEDHYEVEVKDDIIRFTIPR